MTKLVNQKDTKRFDVDIGRGSLYGNHFLIGVDGDREQVVEKYKKYFHKRILTDKTFRDNVLALKGKTLACWCVPLLCHGYVFIDYLEGTKLSEQRKPKEPDFFEL